MYQRVEEEMCELHTITDNNTLDCLHLTFKLPQQHTSTVVMLMGSRGSLNFFGCSCKNSKIYVNVFSKVCNSFVKY